ncbi:MAG: DUF1002 domain-containing protein [Blautia sp.]|nr:DUF1002 domain-containing protein [Blautia sp.]
MIKMKKTAALFMAGFLICSMPVQTLASDIDTEVVENLVDSGIDAIADDPDMTVDIIMYAKDLIDQQNISGEEIRTAIDSAASHFGVNISENEKDSLVNVIQKMLNLNINEEQLRNDVNSAYDKLKSMGVDKEKVKGIAGKIIDFVKGFFE